MTPPDEHRDARPQLPGGEENDRRRQHRWRQDQDSEGRSSQDREPRRNGPPHPDGQQR